MPRKEKYVVATKKDMNGTIVPDKPLGEYREVEFAEHALPSIVREHKVAVAQLAIFQGKTLVKELR